MVNHNNIAEERVADKIVITLNTIRILIIFRLTSTVLLILSILLAKKYKNKHGDQKTALGTLIMIIA